MLKNKAIYLVLIKRVLLSLLVTFLLVPLAQAERIRLERKHGTVNEAFQGMLSKQVLEFSNGVGKIELGRKGGGSCRADLYISPETVYVVLESKKKKQRVELYVDHPSDSFKSVLFQSFVIDGDRSELSVDKQAGAYTFTLNGSKLELYVKGKKDEVKCEFDLAKAITIAGQTE